MKRSTRIKQICLVALILVSLLATVSSYSHAASTEAVSIDIYGNAGFPRTQTMSADGRFIAYDSYTSTLVPDDTNNHCDIFVYDALTGTTERVSVDSFGNEGTMDSTTPYITADGRYVFFDSYAGLTPDCPLNGQWKTFMHDRATKTTECIGEFSPKGISPDGVYVLYRVGESLPDPDLRIGDRFIYNIYALNRLTGETMLVSSNIAGIKGNATSSEPSMSSDGRYIAFSSGASNLVPGDDELADIFVKDLVTGDIEKVSSEARSMLSDFNWADYPSITPDGRYVSFAAHQTIYLKKTSFAKSNVFIYDRQTQTTEQVPFTTVFDRREYGPEYPRLSGNGRYVAFTGFDRTILSSTGSEIIVQDVFRYDRQTGDIIRVSVDSSGNLSNGNTYPPIINEDGQYVVFNSWATNLVEGITEAGALYLRDNFDIDNDTFGDDQDCNDFDATVFPGAPELCKDRLDNDCDGLVDKDDPDCAGGKGSTSSTKIKKVQ